MVIEAPKGSLDQELVTNILSLQVRGIFSTVGEVGMDIGSIDLDQKVDFILDSLDRYSLRASIDGSVLLGKDLAFRMIMGLEFLDDLEVLSNSEIDFFMSEFEGVDIRVVIDLYLVGDDCFNSFRHDIINESNYLSHILCHNQLIKIIHSLMSDDK